MKQAIYSLWVRYRTVRTLVCTEYLNERSWAAPKYIPLHTELRSSSWQYDLLKISADGTGGPSMKTIRDAHALSFSLPLAFSNPILRTSNKYISSRNVEPGPLL